jgi:hypothetical protein
MDRKRVASMEDYEVKYLAQAVTKVGNSRNKVEAN